MGIGYLTPNIIPANSVCRILFVPNDEAYLAIVRGALQVLTEPLSFDKFGALSPEQSASAFVSMFDDFCLGKGVCRMVGEIIAFASSTSPDERLLACDGASLVRADYPDLFNVIGSTYGAIDGLHFSLPDSRGRVFVGSGAGGGLTPRSNGQAFGEESHTLISTEVPSHSHTDLGHTHGADIAVPTVITPGELPVPLPSAVPSVGLTAIGNASLTNAGGDGSHNNIQPSLVISYFIVARD